MKPNREHSGINITSKHNILSRRREGNLTLTLTDLSDISASSTSDSESASDTDYYYPPEYENEKDKIPKIITTQTGGNLKVSSNINNNNNNNNNNNYNNNNNNNNINNNNINNIPPGMLLMKKIMQKSNETYYKSNALIVKKENNGSDLQNKRLSQSLRSVKEEKKNDNLIRKNSFGPRINVEGGSGSRSNTLRPVKQKNEEGPRRNSFMVELHGDKLIKMSMYKKKRRK